MCASDFAMLTEEQKEKVRAQSNSKNITNLGMSFFWKEKDGD